MRILSRNNSNKDDINGHLTIHDLLHESNGVRELRRFNVLNLYH